MPLDLVPDDLWERVAPLLPSRSPRRHRYPGRLPADDRAALRGILYVLCKSVSWRDVPAEQVGCSGVTAWRRLRDWTEAGVWPRLHEVLPAELRAAGLLDMDDVAIDGSHVRALKRGLTQVLLRSTGPGPAASTMRVLVVGRRSSREAETSRLPLLSRARHSKGLLPDDGVPCRPLVP